MKTKKLIGKIVAMMLVLVLFMFLLVACGGNSTKKENDKPQTQTGVPSEKEEEELITLPVTVVNNTGIDIWEFYASVVDTDDWEEDILTDDILFAGESFVIDFTFPSDQVIWDFAMVDGEGNMIAFYEMDFSDCSLNGATLTLEYDGENGYATLE